MNEREAGIADIAKAFLKIGAVSYGGPAIVGIMQTELQEKRRWLTKQSFVDGLALVNMLPGPLATQLGIYIGHAKQGIAGGVVAGLGFVLPAFAIMLILSWVYDQFGTFAVARHSLYGIGPVVVGIFTVAVYRLAKGTITGRPQTLTCIAAMLLMLVTPISLGVTLLAAGCTGIALFNSWRIGLAALAGVLVVAVLEVALSGVGSTQDIVQGVAPIAEKPTLWELGIFFFKVGALTFGGGLSMLAFIQDQVVAQFGWLTPQQFVDGSGTGPVHAWPSADARGVHRLQACWYGWRCRRDSRDFLSVIRNDPVYPAVTSTRAEHGVAAGVHARGGSRGDRCTCRIADTDGAGRRPGHPYVSTACPDGSNSPAA